VEARRGLRWILGPRGRRRILMGVAVLVGAWMSAAGVLFFATGMLEMLAWQPLHRGNQEGAEPLLDAGTVLSRAATGMRVPGQRVRLAGYLGNLTDAREHHGAAVEAAELYLESIEILEAELGAEDSQTRFARWRYHNFLRSTERARDTPTP